MIGWRGAAEPGMNSDPARSHAKTAEAAKEGVVPNGDDGVGHRYIGQADTAFESFAPDISDGVKHRNAAEAPAPMLVTG